MNDWISRIQLSILTFVGLLLMGAPILRSIFVSIIFGLLPILHFAWPAASTLAVAVFCGGWVLWALRYSVAG
jgi:hypothetical protein